MTDQFFLLFFKNCSVVCSVVEIHFMRHENDSIYLDGYSELIQVNFSTKNLKKLVLLHRYLTLKDLAYLLQLFRKLIELRWKPFQTNYWEIDQHVKKPLKRGFQRLKVCEIHFFIDHFSWPVLQDLVR